MYSNQIADLERSYAAQTASTQGMNAIQAQLAQCCCDNRAATADVKYTIATEACQNRATSTAIIKVPRGCCFSVSADSVPATTDPTVTPAPIIEAQNVNIVVNRIA